MIEALASDIVPAASSVALALVPLVIMFLIAQIFMLKLPLRTVKDILLGTALAACGLFLFLLGVGIGFLPYGRAIGEAVGGMREPWLLVGAGLFLGFVTTWGEPAVRILADQGEEASHGSIPGFLVLNAVCVGVAIWAALGMLRVGYGLPLLYLLLPGYGLAILMLWISDKDFVAIAIDAGGVATGPLANTFLLAIALGASAAVEGRNPVVDGLGFVALVALAPIISVMALGLLMGRMKRTEG